MDQPVSSVTPLSQTPTPVQPSSHSIENKIIFLIGAILLLISISSMMYYVGQSNQAPVLPSPLPVTAPAPSPNETSEWKTYKDAEITFKYPPNYTTESKNYGLLDDSQGNTVFWARPLDDVASPQDAYEKLCLNIGPCSEAIDGPFNSSIQFETSGHEYPILDIIVDNGRSIYDLTFVITNSEARTLYDQILSSFEFIESIDTTSWKTYVNTEYGYQALYPARWETIGKEPRFEGELQETVFMREKPSALGLFIIRVLENPENLSLEDWSLKRYVFVTVTNEEKDQRTGESILGGEKAITASLFTYDSHQLAIATLHNGKFYEIEFDEINGNDPNFEENKKIYDQILSSFEFVE